MLRVAILCAAAAGAHAFAADGAAALNFTRVGGLLTDEEVRLVRSLLPADDDAGTRRARARGRISPRRSWEQRS